MRVRVGDDNNFAHNSWWPVSMSRLADHVLRHPWRLLVTSFAVVAATWVIAGLALYESLSSGRKADIQICRNMNELRREAYTTILDLTQNTVIAARFLPVTDCENLP